MQVGKLKKTKGNELQEKYHKHIEENPNIKDQTNIFAYSNTTMIQDEIRKRSDITNDMGHETTINNKNDSDIDVNVDDKDMKDYDGDIDIEIKIKPKGSEKK
eukprot:399256_1